MAFPIKFMFMENKDLYEDIKRFGQKHAKIHGSWYVINVFDNHHLVLDTWNGHVYHYPNGCVPSDTDNMYSCVYVFHDEDGRPENRERVKGSMNTFWYAHIHNLNK